MIHETTKMIVQIKNRLLATCSRQKSYAGVRRKPLEFEVGGKVMLKVSPWKGVVQFEKCGKLSPRYIGPFKILSRVGPEAYKLKLPRELQGVYNTFHDSNLKKCLSDEDLIIPLDEVRIDEKFYFIKEPIEIMDREVLEGRDVEKLVDVVYKLGSSFGEVAELSYFSYDILDIDNASKSEEDSDELEYPQEFFSAVDLLSLQFLWADGPTLLLVWTLDQSISCVMQGAFCTQRKVSMVSFGRISLNMFLSSILLVVVIIITVVVVVVILVVVIFAIVEVVIILMVFGVVSRFSYLIINSGICDSFLPKFEVSRHFPFSLQEFRKIYSTCHGSSSVLPRAAVN
ncbi:hypothetical protein Tco_1476237 [Tanacetum coccineum]